MAPTLYSAKITLLVLFQYALWTITVVLQATTGVLIVRRKLHRIYAFFFAYTVFCVIRSVLLYLTLSLHTHQHLTYATYFFVFWGTDVISLVICVGVMYAVVRKLFDGFTMLRHYASVAFGGSLVVLLGAAIMLSAVQKGNDRRLMGSVLALNRSILFVQLGLVVLTCLFAAWAALPWRSNVSFGIALGFGIQAGVEVVAVTMRSEIGSVGNSSYQILRSASYAIAVLIWLLYIRAPQSSELRLEQELPLADVQGWNKALTEMLKE